MSEADFFEQAKLYLPKYLTPENKEELYSEIRAFPTIKRFYLSDTHNNEFLQGDGWRGLVAINFDTCEKKPVSGVIVSNSCDIDPRNPTPRDRMVLFCPLISLNKYREVLLGAGKSEDQIQAVLESLRRQEITYAFHLPEKNGEIQESMILLDDVHRHPLRDFLICEKQKRFALGQFAFYLLLVKLSIHFSRFQENLNRFP